MRNALALWIVLLLAPSLAGAAELEGYHETRVKELLVKPVHLVSKDIWHGIGVPDVTNEVLIKFVPSTASPFASCTNRLDHRLVILHTP